MTGLVVIGASYAGIHGALSARDGGYCEPITVVADEEWLPYQRPPLSKDFLADLATEESLVLRDKAFFSNKGIDLVLGARATNIDRRSRKVALNDHSELIYDKLLIGTGSCARKLPVPGADLNGVQYLRTMQDAIDLKTSLREASEIVVVGGGFIGLEVAASARKLGKKVTLLENASRLLERAVSPTISKFLLDLHLLHGVDVRLGANVTSIEGQGGRATSVACGDQTNIRADIVVVGVGGLANDTIARNAGLNCTNGITVDDHGRTSEPDIFAAGDCATHYNHLAQDWVRLESVQNAQDQAKAAGLAIAGRTGPYGTVPRFWSDQYELKFQIVGISRNFDQQALRGSIDDGRFSVFYYRQGRLIAVDSVNRPGDQMAARRLIAGGASPPPEQISDSSFDLKSLL